MRALENDSASVCMHGVELEDGREKYPPYGLSMYVISTPGSLLHRIYRRFALLGSFQCRFLKRGCFVFYENMNITSNSCFSVTSQKWPIFFAR